MPLVQVGDERMYYVAQGRQGIPAVFVHGSGSNHLIWWGQVKALEPFARPVTLDLPGHGKSSGPGRASVEDYRDVVLRFLDALGFSQAVVVGHSLGGAIAQSLALAHPDRVAGLSLVGTGARLRVLPAILDGILTDFDQTVALVVENSHAPGLAPEMRARAENEMRECAPQVIHDDFAACNNFDLMAQVFQIRTPTLVVVGRQDRMTPVKYSEYLVSKMPQARLVVVENAGHFVMVEQPTAVNRELIQFVSSLSG